jgi:ribonuclease HII
MTTGREARRAWATDPCIAGVDEAGRGPLAGPVVAAVVILDPSRPIAGLADSKALRPAARERLAEAIRSNAVAWAVAYGEVAEIDATDILRTTLHAMRRAVASLGRVPDEVQVDGNICPDFGLPARAIVRGDATEPAISAASILAKTERDAWCVRLAQRLPLHGFAQHKGYGTRAHLEALVRHGVTDAHRRSFAPVRAVLEGRVPAWGRAPR